MPDPDHVTPWVSEGVRWVVSTECAPGQSAQECEDEHEEAVAVLQVLHPPD